MYRFDTVISLYQIDTLIIAWFSCKREAKIDYH